MTAAREIFVFGSNLSGLHGGGAAATAYAEHGAEWGNGEGIQGNSYGVPTVGLNMARALPLEEIGFSVQRFVYFAKAHPELRFKVTRIGCGIAGYKDADISPMFSDAPENCDLPTGWRL